jgi:cytochrome P450
MLNLFSDDMRRNPYPTYAHLRATSPVLHVPPPFDGWLILDYDGVKRALNDNQTFSSRVPAPKNWFIFYDAPAHTKQRALISQAFTPRMIANLEPSIRELSHQLLAPSMERGEIDIATDYSVPLPMKVIASMIGFPEEEWERYKRWSDVILRISFSRSGGSEAQQTIADFTAVTAEMSEYLAKMITDRRAGHRDDLLTRLAEAEVDGERLSHEEIVGFVQLLVVAGQETTSDLINNAVLTLLEHPDQLAGLRAMPELLPSVIEEVLRYRSPLQWTLRTPKGDVQLSGTTIPANAFVLAVIGSANRDPRIFADPDRFDITRDPNPHVAFGHGIHFCIGAALSRLESRIALSDLLHRWDHFEHTTTDPWSPRRALNVLGPASLPIRFTPAGIGAAHV